MKSGCKKWFFIALTFLVSFSCKKEIQPENVEKSVPEIQKEMVSDSIVYDFVNNTLLVENEIYKECENLFDRKPEVILNEDFTWLEKLDSVFTKQDIEFIKNQYLNEQNLIWDKNKLKGKNVIDFTTTNFAQNPDDYWENLQEFYDNVGCFSILRIPVFNLKKDLAIVEVQYNYALDWGRSETCIYRKNTAGKWERYITLWELVS